MKSWFEKLVKVKGQMLKEENDWIWSLILIFGLLFTAFILLYFLYPAGY